MFKELETCVPFIVVVVSVPEPVTTRELLTKTDPVN